MMGLTPQLRDCLDFIQTCISGDGVPPTIDEIVIAMGLSSKSGAHRMLSELEDRGIIRRLYGQARAIEIIDAVIVCPHCGNVAGSEKCIAAAQAMALGGQTPVENGRKAVGLAPVGGARQ